MNWTSSQQLFSTIFADKKSQCWSSLFCAPTKWGSCTRRQTRESTWDYLRNLLGRWFCRSKTEEIRVLHDVQPRHWDVYGNKCWNSPQSCWTGTHQWRKCIILFTCWISWVLVSLFYISRKSAYSNGSKVECCQVGLNACQMRGKHHRNILHAILSPKRGN